jgi:hypothetical protein
MRTETELNIYQGCFERGAALGRDARRVMPRAELAEVRTRLTRIAGELEAIGEPAAFARGFLRATDTRGTYAWSD